MFYTINKAIDVNIQGEHGIGIGKKVLPKHYIGGHPHGRG